MELVIFVVVITGGVVSAYNCKVTVTVKVSVVVFPVASDAVQVTVVVPTGNNVPGGVGIGI